MPEEKKPKPTIKLAVPESVSTEFSVTMQIPTGYVKAKAGITSCVRPDESVDDAFVRCWTEVMDQVKKVTEGFKHEED